MDLLEGAKKIIITTLHTSTDGAPKFVDKCAFPITSKRVADVLITDLAVFEWKDNSYVLTELMGNATLEEVQEKTTANYTVCPNLAMKEGT